MFCHINHDLAVQVLMYKRSRKKDLSTHGKCTSPDLSTITDRHNIPFKEIYKNIHHVHEIIVYVH